MKILLIIIDGLGDKPISQLGSKTPLEAAKTPNLNRLVKNGICGLVLPFCFPGDIPHSETAHLALFGYDPKIYYLGRGPYEAAGIGVNIQKGDVILRVNFATVNENLKVIDRRAGRIEGTQSLIKALSKIKIKLQPPRHPRGPNESLGGRREGRSPASGPLGVRFLIKKSYGHRAVLVLRGENLSSAITDGDIQRTGERIKKILPISFGKCGAKEIKKAKFTAKALNEFLEESHQILKTHPLNKKREKEGLLPANYLLVRGAGEVKKTPSFKEKYNLRAAFVAGGALYKGIGKILGMKEVKTKGATGLLNTNLKAKFLSVKKGLKKYDFIFLHIKATDTLSEDGNFLGKKEFIEKIDKNLKNILGLKDTLIVITADHSTCSALKRHCLEPIPLLIYGDGRDGTPNFSEKACQKGKLGEIKQLDLMPKILSLVN